MTPPTPALNIQHLSKSYQGTKVVDELSLEIQPGEMVALLGPNGAGKSTTINMITGVARIDSGFVQVFGKDNQTQYKETRSMVGVMHQEIVIEPVFPIGRTLKFFSGYYGIKDDPAWRNLLVERLALGPHLKKTIHKLSGGMKRRFMAAKALIHKPKLLILDEPTAGVDVELRHALWEFVKEINRDGMTVLLTTHYLDEAEQLCNRIAIMNHGKLVALDTTRNLMKKLDKKKLQIRLPKPLLSLPHSLSIFDGQLREEGNVVEFQLPKNTATGEVLSVFFKEGLQIGEVETHEPSLEEVFLKLTTDLPRT